MSEVAQSRRGRRVVGSRNVGTLREHFEVNMCVCDKLWVFIIDIRLLSYFIP